MIPVVAHCIRRVEELTVPNSPGLWAVHRTVGNTGGAQLQVLWVDKIN